VFEIENYTDSQRRWADTKQRKIEEAIEHIARSILATAAFEKRRRAERGKPRGVSLSGYNGCAIKSSSVSKG
jgi:hypothetical protein